MKLIKFLIGISVLTLAALLYVHQQIELVKVSYTINAKEKAVKELVDRKESLLYNIANLEAPSRLEKVLSAKKIDIVFPKRGQIVKVAKAPRRVFFRDEIKLARAQRKGNFSRIIDFFSQVAEAQAHEK